MAQPPAIEPFPLNLARELDTYLQSHPNKTMFTGKKREEYRYWLLNPEKKSQGNSFDARQQKNIKHDALKKYELVDGQLYRQSETVKKRGHGGLEIGRRLVVVNNDIFKYIKSVHIEVGHAGISKTWEAFNSQYYGVNKDTVIWLLARCAICLHDRPNKTRAPLEPIVVNQRLERVQVDLIDMRHQPDGQFKWICHFRDHYSKFSVLFPMKSKTAVEVANCVCSKIISILLDL